MNYLNHFSHNTNYIKTFLTEFRKIKLMNSKEIQVTIVFLLAKEWAFHLIFIDEHLVNLSFIPN